VCSGATLNLACNLDNVAVLFHPQYMVLKHTAKARMLTRSQISLPNLATAHSRRVLTHRPTRGTTNHPRRHGIRVSMQPVHVDGKGQESVGEPPRGYCETTPTMRVGPCICVKTQLYKGAVGPTSWGNSAPLSLSTLVEKSDLSSVGYMNAAWWC
jgi:hypothetical protein